MRTDNNTASGIMNNTVKQNMSKTMDMRFYRLQDRVNQGMLRVYWGPGKENLADYYRKRFAAIQHKKVRPIYVYDKDRSPNTLQGCVEILAAPDKKKPPLRAITPVTRLTNPLTQLTNLERLYNSRLRLPAAVAAMVRLVNRISKTTFTQLS